MTRKILVFYSAFIISMSISYAQLINPMNKKVMAGLRIEAGGLSPIFSMNAEKYLMNGNNFFCGRVGIGHLFTKYSLSTIPHSISYNILLNGNKHGCTNFKSRKALYVEAGVGGVFLVKPIEQTPYRWSPIIGVRKFLAYNVSANGYWSAHIIPVVAGRIVPYGSIGIGLLVD